MDKEKKTISILARKLEEATEKYNILVAETEELKLQKAEESARNASAEENAVMPVKFPSSDAWKIQLQETEARGITANEELWEEVNRLKLQNESLISEMGSFKQRLAELERNKSSSTKDIGKLIIDTKMSVEKIIEEVRKETLLIVEGTMKKKEESMKTVSSSASKTEGISSKESDIIGLLVKWKD